MLSITNYQGNAKQKHKEYNPVPLMMAITKKARNNKCWCGCGEKQTLVHVWWECAQVQLPWKTILEVSQEVYKRTVT